MNMDDGTHRRQFLVSAVALASVGCAGAANRAPLASTTSDDARRGAREAEPRWFWEPHDRAMIVSLGLSRTARVLDAGCGKGDHVQLLAEHCSEGSVAALDISPKVIARIKVRFADSELEGRIATHEADVQKLPFDVGTFDLAWSSHTMHILNDPVAGVRELARVVKPGGRVVIREDGPSMRLLPLDIGIGEPGLEYRILLAFTKWYTADRLERGRVPFGWSRVLENAGLRDIATTSFLHQLSPPFSARQADYLRKVLLSRADLEHLDATDRATLLRIAEPGTPDDALARDDLHVTNVSTMYVGKVGT